MGEVVGLWRGWPIGGEYGEAHFEFECTGDSDDGVEVWMAPGQSHPKWLMIPRLSSTVSDMLSAQRLLVAGSSGSNPSRKGWSVFHRVVVVVIGMRVEMGVLPLAT